MKIPSKWIIVMAVTMMLLGMFAYVASDDEAYPPTEPNTEQAAE